MDILYWYVFSGTKEQVEYSMDYELLLNEIINIGKEMIKSGAETDRAEDSMYRMLESMIWSNAVSLQFRATSR